MFLLTEIKWLLVNWRWTALVREVFGFLYLPVSSGENLSHAQVFIFCALEESGLLPYLWQPSEICEEEGNEQGHILFPS